MNDDNSLGVDREDNCQLLYQYQLLCFCFSFELTFKSSNKSDMRYMLQLLIRENGKKNALILLRTITNNVLIYL